MTAPIYTATAGPADPNAGTRAKVYAGIGGVFALLTLAQVFGLIKADQAASIKDFIDSGLGLLGTFGFAFVATKTQKQVGDGTFDAAPDPVIVAPPISTSDQIINALPNLVQEVADKAAELDRVKQAAADAFGNVPVVGGLAQELIDRFAPRL